MSSALDECVTGPSIVRDADRPWLQALRPLERASAACLALNRGWDLGWERQQWQQSSAAGSRHLSVRLLDGEILLGPLWVPDTDSGCAGCCELRARMVLAHPLVADLSLPLALAAAPSPLLVELLEIAASAAIERPLEPGELYAVGVRSSRRHRIRRSFDCPVCSPARAPISPEQPPIRAALRSSPAAAGNPTRTRSGTTLLNRSTVRDQIVDPRFGPVQQIVREWRTPLAMSEAILPESNAMGYGRALTFAETEPIAVLEAYERLAGFPHESGLLVDVAYQDLGPRALDPASLGQYSPEQLAHPSSKVMPSGPETPMDWVWGHDLATAEALLVPAEIGFYHYEYRYRLNRLATRDRTADALLRFYAGSSSGCAVGSSFEEAALHSLLELAERDAFLLSWHRAAPLPAIAAGSITDPASLRLLELIDARGFDVHLLVATRDIDVPVVWALAVNKTGGFPAAFSSAGSGIHPEAAVQGALWELAQILTDPIDWDRSAAESMLADPWRVQTLHDHVRLYTLPESLPRTSAVLGGPPVRLDEAFPGWPERLVSAAKGDLRGALDYVTALFADAGLTRLVIVDQTTREHADLGISVTNAVVPGIIPMCFGFAHQRLSNLPRLTAVAPAATGYDPHPFP